MLKPSTPMQTINATATPVTVTQTSIPYHQGGYATVKAFLTINTATGTSPTLVVKFQDSADGITGWTDIASGAFSSQNAAGSSSLVLNSVGPFLRAVQTVGGTTPSFNYDLKIAGV